MKKAAVYTRTGDKGQTGLVGGSRIKKSDMRIHLYGEVDELNSHIGYGVSLLDETFDKKFLFLIQSALFDLGSNLACEVEKREKFNLPQISAELIKEIENEIDTMDAALEPLKYFVLPGGEPAAAYFHICRTFTRKVEREMIGYQEEKPLEIPNEALAFLNRLSDYFFTLSRYINVKMGIKEISWIPHQK